jgi:hypothetical protein
MRTRLELPSSKDEDDAVEEEADKDFDEELPDAPVLSDTFALPPGDSSKADHDDGLVSEHSDDNDGGVAPNEIALVKGSFLFFLSFGTFVASGFSSYSILQVGLNPGSRIHLS